MVTSENTTTIVYMYIYMSSLCF